MTRRDLADGNAFEEALTYLPGTLHFESNRSARTLTASAGQEAPCDKWGTRH